MSSPSAVAPAATRRCWRCLQMFACAPEDVVAGAAEWWLCDPCHDSLMGSDKGTPAR